MFRNVAITVAAIFLFCLLSQAQKSRFKDRIDVSLNAAGAISKQSAGNGVTLTPTQGSGIFGSLRFRLAKRSSLEVTIGRAKNSQLFNAPPLQYRIQGPITEVTGSYVYRLAKRGKFEPFFIGGAGVLVFSPNETKVFDVVADTGATRETRPTFLYGGGVDYQLHSHIAIRAQYRGLFYRAPDYHLGNLVTGSNGHLAEPSLGVVFKF